MDQGRVRVIGRNLRNRADLRVVHNDRVAFRVPGAKIISLEVGEKFLEELTVYLYNAFLYIQENIEETLLSDIEVEQTIRKNLLSNVEKFKNRRAE